MRANLKMAALLGITAGTLEFLLRTDARLGFGFFDQLLFCLLAVAANLAVALPAGILASAVQRLPYVGKRPVGLVLGSLLGLHVALHYRFQVVLNESLRSPALLAGLFGLFAGSLLFGLTLHRNVAPRIKWLVAVALFAFWGGFVRGLPTGPAQEVEGPNVLLITWDTTRPDRLSAYGGPAQTPTLDRLVAEGTRFDQAVAPAPLTEPSHLAILSGQRTTTTGVLSNGTPLGEQPRMLQRAFAERGYRSGAVVSGFPLHSRYGWSEGWDVYDDDFGAIAGLHRLSLVKLIDEIVLPANTLRERRGTIAVDRALTFLSRHERGRWFLWVHFFDPHAPYEARPITDAPTDGEPLALPGYWPPPHKAITDADYLTAAYDAELEHTDALTGELIAWLEVHGLLDDTLIVMTADHGESLTEHGVLFDHGDDLFDPSLRVPLILRGPGVPAGTTQPCQLSTIDIAPTLEHLVPLIAVERDGQSFQPWLSGAPCEDRPVLSSTIGARFVEEPPVDLSLRQPESKYIRKGQERGEALYDLVSDPGETRDISAQVPEVVDAASEAMDAVLDGQPIQAREQAMDAETLQALQALGYMGD